MILILGLALARAGADVLSRDQPRLQADDLAERSAQAVDDECCRYVAAFGQRLQADEHAPLVLRRVGPARTDGRADAVDGRIGQYNFEGLGLKLAHGRERDVGGSFRRGHDEAGVVLGQIAFGKDAVEVHRHHEGGDEYGERDETVGERDAQRARVGADYEIERAFEQTVEECLAVRCFGFHEMRADHRRDAERNHGRDDDRERHRHGELVQQRPTTPVMNNTGMKAATSDTEIETTVKPIWRAPSSAACIGVAPFSMLA